MQKAFVLEQIRSNKLSLQEKMALSRNANFGADKSVEDALNEEIKLMVEPLDGRAALKVYDDSGGSLTVLYLILPKIVPGSLTTEEVLEKIKKYEYNSGCVQMIDRLMEYIDWKSVSKDTLAHAVVQSRPDGRFATNLVLKAEVFDEPELLELVNGHWKGKYIAGRGGFTFSSFREVVLASRVVTKVNKVKLATEHGPTNAQKHFATVLRSTEFTDQELLEIAESRTVAGCWTLIHPYLKKYRNLLKVARILKTDEAWDIFIEKGKLAEKSPKQILRVAKVSGNSKVWSLYFGKATEPLITHEELMWCAEKFKRYALWAVLLPHVDYQKLSLERIFSLVRSCDSAAHAWRSSSENDDRRRDLHASFEVVCVLAKHVPWNSVPYEKKIEALWLHYYPDWQQAIADSLETIQLRDWLKLADAKKIFANEVKEALQSKAV